MSRHTVLHLRKGNELVLGYDPMLRAFFGQVMTPTGYAIAGDPTRHGLGVQPFVETEALADAALDRLIAWAATKGLHEAGCREIRGQLRAEWREDVAP